ncbi:MAG: pyruvate dehydrogenase (acetyl-transferring), homodimeric type [Gammaproteobacteria bacterium]|nr:pyruvate dehydrogenase (acetyl-transferring), homodimeric type [Gammaproteobacteria bacterium]
MAAVPRIPLHADADAQETQEWLDALGAVIQQEGAERAHYLIEKQIELARAAGINFPYSANTAYVNTIPPEREVRSPGNHELEHTIRSYVRWNALAMVLKANKDDSGLGGHIASFASAATLYDVGFNHFWRAPKAEHGGDLILYQGHSAPGIYARSFLQGQLTAEQMDQFRREVDGKGLSSYPHPWLMPNFWQMPTVSMGLGPIQAIYQARFMKYLHDRGLANTENRKVWCFVGDGETDEPESLGAIGLAGRESLDNLIFVINCNLQRLDGPVRGNGKIIQELEGEFRGAGWNVIKLIWGSYWDPLLARDTQGLLRKRMEECVDGDYQTFKSKDGAYVREHFFGKYPELKAMVANWSDDDIWRLNRGGHDPHKVYAAYYAAMNHTGQPTVILAKTIKGYGMGESGEAQNITHQQKKMGTISLKTFRDRFKLPLSDAQLENLDYIKPADDSPEMKYMHDRRQALGGNLPVRRPQAPALEVPALSAFDALLKASGEGREFSTTMAFVRLLSVLVKDKKIGKHVVPIVADESRTFGMEGMFRQLGIWSHVGQLYTPQDKDQLMFYKEEKTGQILQEGINEAGATCSWLAAATSYSMHGVQMIPFFIFYSMFGVQRVGDLWWAAGDSRARGFLLGGTSGRTTLNGEGLQHEDGHSHVWAASIPNCIPYDPTYAYELAVIMHDGLRRMLQQQEDVYYYITVMNENYEHPAMPEGVEPGILKGMYLLKKGAAGKGARVQLLGSGVILREVIAAAELLKKDWNVDADIWSCPSFTLLARDGNDVARWNLLHPTAEPRLTYVEQNLKDTNGPVIASTDYVRAFAEQIRPFVPRRYSVLGTDGYGRSDTREKLRHFFEVDRRWIVLAALKALADEGQVDRAKVGEVIKKYKLDPEKPNPTKV